jgi:hypothetical protein
MLTCLLLALLVQPDTLRIAASSAEPTFDGVVSEAEYGAPTVVIPRAQGAVRIWAVESQAAVYLAVQLPDTSFYWGDDVVISLDVWGDRGPAPGHDDFQWYFRRVLDSSVVYRGEQGKWRAPRDDPDWRLGAEREGGGWEVRSASDGRGWSLEFRLDRAYFLEAKQGTPAIALRVYDDAPHGWHTWPVMAGVRHPTEVERRPELWIPVTLASSP